MERKIRILSHVTKVHGCKGVVNLMIIQLCHSLQTTHNHLLIDPFHSTPKEQTNWRRFCQTKQHYDCTWEMASTKQRREARKQASGCGETTCRPWWPARLCARLPNGTQSASVCEATESNCMCWLVVVGGSHAALCALQLPSLPQRWLRQQT